MKDVPGQAKELTKLKTSDLAVQLAQNCEPDIAPGGRGPKASLICERNCRLQAMLAFVAARIFKSAGLPQHILLYSDACFKACMSCKEKCNSCTT